MVATTKRMRRIASVIALAGALAGPATGIAEAPQNVTVGGGQTGVFHTWFFGRTEVCVKNVGVGNEPFYWISGPSGAPGNVNAGQTTCFTRSFGGFIITIADESASPLQVTFPIGP